MAGLRLTSRRNMPCPGVPPTETQRIFERFAQLSEARTRTRRRGPRPRHRCRDREEPGRKGGGSGSGLGRSPGHRSPAAGLATRSGLPSHLARSGGRPTAAQPRGFSRASSAALAGGSRVRGKRMLNRWSLTLKEIEDCISARVSAGRPLRGIGQVPIIWSRTAAPVPKDHQSALTIASACRLVVEG